MGRPERSARDEAVGPSTMISMQSTAPSFVPALDSLGDIVPHEGILDPAELEQVARDIAARRELWEPLTYADTERRRYELLFEDDRMDAWVLSWMPGQATGFHDHYISSVGLCIAQGCVREDQMRYGAEPSSATCPPVTRATATRATSTASGTGTARLP